MSFRQGVHPLVPRRFPGMLLTAAFLLSWAATATAASTWYVWAESPSNGPGSSWATALHSMAGAVAASSAGDTVLVTNGTYAVTAEILVDKAINLRSVNGPAVTIVDAGWCRAIHTTAAALIDGFTFTGGYDATSGGGVYCSGGSVFRNCRVTSCTSRFGSGVFVDQSGTLDRCTVQGNASVSDSKGGGVYLYHGGVLEHTIICNNSASYGGGLYAEAGGVARSSLIASNQCLGIGKLGGGAYLAAGGALENCTLVANRAPSVSAQAGGVYAAVGSATVNTIVRYNQAAVAGTEEWGGGGAWTNCCTLPSNGAGCVTGDPGFVNAAGGNFRLHPGAACTDRGATLAWCVGATDLEGVSRLHGASVDIGAYESGRTFVSPAGSHVYPFVTWATAATNIQEAVDAATSGWTTVVTNGTYRPAAEIVLTGRVDLVSVWGAAVTVVNGGGAHRVVRVATNALVEGFTFTGGYVADQGGGVYAYGGARLRDCLIRGNTSAQYGGGLMLRNTGTVERCRFENNRAQANDGGGVYLARGGLLLDCVVSSNSARHGGGLFLEGGGHLRSCLVISNSASLQGGGVHVYLPGGVVESSTLADNRAGVGGGVYCNAGGTLRDSIAFDNFASVSSSNHNGVGAWFSCCTYPAVGTACVAKVPRFADRTGGDYRLQEGSPCLNAGTSAAWMDGAVDLDGRARVLAGRVDIGAYEFPYVLVAQGTTPEPPYLSWDTAATNIQDAINIASNAAQIVLVDTGVYRCDAELVLDRPITVRSRHGPSATVVDGGQAHRCWRVMDGVVDGFTITNGLAVNGGGVYLQGPGVVQRCVIAGNTAGGAGTSHSGGGGVFCAGSGLVCDSVIAGNTVVHGTYNGGGGVRLQTGGTARNCLIYHNTAPGPFYNYGGGVYCYCGGSLENCTVAGNSADVGGGVMGEFGGSILNSVIWQNSARVGANWHEFEPYAVWAYCDTTPPVAGEGCLALDPLFRNGAGADFRLLPASPCLDAGRCGGWMDGAFDVAGQPRVVCGVVDMGAHEYADSSAHYVSPTGGNRHPYLHWRAAATSIQLALDATGAGDTVWVADGVYAPTAEICVTQNVTLASVGGAAACIVDGGASHRCLNVSTTAVVDGFTLRNGYAAGAVGGGAYTVRGGALRNCRIVGNTAGTYGGGVFQNTGGGLLDHCLIWSNTAVSNQGGGVYCNAGATVRNCLIHHNASREGGGVFINNGAVESCTIVTNRATALFGGGVMFWDGGSVSNSIVHANTAALSDPNIRTRGIWRVDYTCTSPDPGGVGNTTEDPAFAAPGDYRLPWDSPCVDVGRSQAWMSGALDLDAYRRVAGAAPDMGAYESREVHYVSLSGANVPPYWNWSGAAVSLQAAVDASQAGDEIRVTNGTYVLAGGVCVTQVVWVASVNGAAVTTIDGGGLDRCVYVGAGAVLDGFTLTNGRATSASYQGAAGGGAYCAGGAQVRYCRAAGNVSDANGGGLCVAGGGVVEHSVAAGNTAAFGGGGVYLAENATARVCRISGNAAREGGGVYCGNGVLENCLVVRNHADWYGSGIQFYTGGKMRNCTIAANDNGGVKHQFSVVDFGSEGRNCIVYHNAGSDISSDYYISVAYLYTCTPSWSGTGNVTADPQLTPDFRLRAASPCIDAGIEAGAPGLDGDDEPRWDDPRHANAVSCFDIGQDEFVDTNLNAMADTWEWTTFSNLTHAAGADDDHDHLSALGEYEHATLALCADTDGDGMPDGEEVVADTDPNDALSRLVISDIVAGPDGISISWQGGVNVTQYLDRCGRLPAEPADWNVILTNAPPTPVSNIFNDSAAPAPGAFYRLRVEGTWH